MLLDELAQIQRRGHRHCAGVGQADLLEKRSEKTQAIDSGAPCQSSGIAHVSVEPAKFGFDGIVATALAEDAGMLE